MPGREKFSDWKDGDDFQAMREVRSVDELKAADTDILGAEERARVLASFTATSLSEFMEETDESE